MGKVVGIPGAIHNLTKKQISGGSFKDDGVGSRSNRGIEVISLGSMRFAILLVASIISFSSHVTKFLVNRFSESKKGEI